jgi:nucleoside-diphosphate-sugar epimerase
MRKVGVTGGAGFIGQYVCEELLSQGYTPVVYDHHNRNSCLDGCEVFLGDVRDEVAVMEFAAHVDGIIHLAAVLGTQETINNPRPAAMSNLQGGLNFLEACTAYQLPGTYICVGNHWMDNTYSITKTMVERFVNMFNKNRDTRINCVRAVNAYGPRQLAASPFAESKVRKIIPSFVCRALSGLPIEVYGDGDNISDMVYVGDVAYALVASLKEANKGIVFDRVVECGPEEHFTVNQVAELVNIFTGNIQPVIHLSMRPGETPGVDVIADITTLDLVGMVPSDMTSLRDGLQATVEYFRQTEGIAWRRAL